MTPEEQERIRQLIAGAQRLSPSERDAFLSRSCGPDLALRAHVESLLALPNNANTTTDGGHFEVANGAPTDPNLRGLRLKGRYLLQNELGRGGFGVVYLAKDEQLHSKLVVIKVMPQSTADRWKRKKFRDEIEALARLNHPGIVSILDSGETDDGRLFLVMEYLKGEMLRSLIPPGGMELERVTEIVRQVGRALDAAHRECIWHRDVKPENIMVHSSEDGEERIKLIDFGIASVDTLRTKVDPNTHIAGTISYMAPEQLRGMPSAASDIYSLGVVVYEMVTGKLPFPAANAVDLHAMQTAGVQVRPRNLRPDLPEGAEEPILKALQFAENDRHHSAMDFVRALLEGLRAGTGTASPVSGDAAGSVTGRRPFQLRRALIAAMLLVAAGFLIFGVSRSGLLQGKHSGASVRSLAVLPFANAGGDPGWDYLADGVTESMINRLSRIRDLTVLSRAAVFRVKRDEPPLEQGRRLGVDAVLTGTIRHFADHLEASVELVDCATGRHIWGERYRQLFQDPLTFEKSAVEDTAAQLRARLDSGIKQNVTRNYTANLDTYRLYLKGRYEWNKRSVKASDQAIQYFRQALDLDPSYALAWAGIADAYSFQSGYLPASEIFPKAQEAAHKALELDPDLAEAHASLGLVYVQYVWDWGKAEAEFRRALQLNPNYPSSHSMYARLLEVLGRFPEAEAEIAKAQVLDPLSPGIAIGVALEYYLARDYLRAEQQLHKILKLEPTSYVATSYLALARVAKGDAKAGILGYQQLLANNPDDLSTMADLVRAYSIGGRAVDAAALMDRIDKSPRYGTLLPTSLAEAHGALGRIDAAFVDLDRAFNERCWYLIFLNVEPIFDPLRHDRRFRDIQRKMALAG